MSCQCVEGSDAIGGCGDAKTRPANPYPLSGLRTQGPDSRDSAAEPGFDVSRHYRSDISSTAGGHMLPLRAIRFDRWVGGSELIRVGSEWRRKGRRVGEPGEGGALEDAKESRGCAG